MFQKWSLTRLEAKAEISWTSTIVMYAMSFWIHLLFLWLSIRGLPIPVCLSCEGKRAEKRLDPEDGTVRTKAEFVESYGANQVRDAAQSPDAGEGDDETDDACLVCGNGGTLHL